MKSIKKGNRGTMKIEMNKYRIRNDGNHYILDLMTSYPVISLYFNNYQNAVLVKRILEYEEGHTGEDCNYYLGDSVSSSIY